MKTRYKFLRTGYKSENGDMKWKVGKWYTCEGELGMCNTGFHCSKGIYQAFSYVQGEILAKVEVKGKSIVENDKEVWEKMRIIKSWRWVKKYGVLFAIYSARLALGNFEKKYPNDDKPRKAIEAAERWVKNPSKKNRLAAGSAAWSAAWSARSAAESAAWSAAWSARSAAESAARSARSARSAAGSAAGSAARSARSAAESAARSAWSAWSAAESAARSARSAAWSAICKKLDVWMKRHLKDLRVLQEV